MVVVRHVGKNGGGPAPSCPQATSVFAPHSWHLRQIPHELGQTFGMTTSSTPRPDGFEESQEPSYIDYETFLSPDFNPALFANSLVLSTNNPNDAPLDLATPLSRVLFDAQEIDSHIDLLTTRSALPLLSFTQKQTSASQRIVSELDSQITSLNDSYKQLEKEVINKHEEADEVRQVAERLWATLAMGRSVTRCLQLGRQLELQHAELGSAAAIDDHTALVRCSYTILSLREVLDNKAPGEEGHGLSNVSAIRSLQDIVIAPIERSIRETADRFVREFTVPHNMTFSQGEESRARLGSAIVALYLLSPVVNIKHDKWSPRILTQALETYMRTTLQGSVTTFSRSLGQLPSLEKALAEVTAKCQNIVVLELLLSNMKAPTHPLLPPNILISSTNLLQPFLSVLETGSLPSYFWRMVASSISGRVQDIVTRGGAVARTLRANKNNVGEAIRVAVIAGCQIPPAYQGPKAKLFPESHWDREIAVMVGSVLNNLR